ELGDLVGRKNAVRSELDGLADPSRHTEAIDLRNERTESLVADLRKMIEIRVVEEAIADLVVSGEAKCPCHLAIGQEAVPVGVSRSLRPTDRIFGNHRSHAQYLAVGGSTQKLLA